MKMRPVIIKFNNGCEKWYPSITEAAEENGLKRETLRSIVENKRFGKRNYQGIEMAWWSDWNREKVDSDERETETPIE